MDEERFDLILAGVNALKWLEQFKGQAPPPFGNLHGVPVMRDRFLKPNQIRVISGNHIADLFINEKPDEGDPAFNDEQDRILENVARLAEAMNQSFLSAEQATAELNKLAAKMNRKGGDS